MEILLRNTGVCDGEANLYLAKQADFDDLAGGGNKEPGRKTWPSAPACKSL
jgi:hypothetical protein